MIFVVVAANLECLRGHACGIGRFGETEIEAVVGQTDVVHVHRHGALPGEFLNAFTAGPAQVGLSNIERSVRREGEAIYACSKAIFFIKGQRCALRHTSHGFRQQTYDARNIHFADEHLIGVGAELANGGVE